MAVAACTSLIGVKDVPDVPAEGGDEELGSSTASSSGSSSGSGSSTSSGSSTGSGSTSGSSSGGFDAAEEEPAIEAATTDAPAADAHKAADAGGG